MSRADQKKSISSQMRNQLREPAMDFISSSREYEEAFEDFEAFADLALIERVKSRDGDVRTLGRSYWGEPVSRLREILEEQDEDWPPLQAEMFDAPPDHARELLDKLGELATV